MTQTSPTMAHQRPPLPSDLEPIATSPDDDTATRLQPHEQLLVGWTVGGTMMTTGTTTTNDDNERRGQGRGQRRGRG
jgi:hypothetical protein